MDADGNTGLVFSRAGPEFALEPGVAGQRVGYRLRAGTLELLYWPQLDNVDAARPCSAPRRHPRVPGRGALHEGAWD
jgi:hypothetical protein